MKAIEKDYLKTNIEHLLKEKYGYSALQIFLAEKEWRSFESTLRMTEDKFPDYVLDDIRKLKKGYPLDYLIGYKDFLGYKIDLRFKTLIPRPETEYWVEKAISEIKSTHEQSNDLLILDMFCGSGCIGISLLKSLKNSSLVFLDKDAKAINQTTLNLEINGIHKDYFTVVKSDLFHALEHEDIRFDYIFANPPYVDISDPNIGKEVAHEPKIALFADDKGLSIIKEFLKQARRYLLPDGIIFMEFGYDQKDQINQYLKELELYEKWRFHKDQFGNWRWVEVR